MISIQQPVSYEASVILDDVIQKVKREEWLQEDVEWLQEEAVSVFYAKFRQLCFAVHITWSSINIDVTPGLCHVWQLRPATKMEDPWQKNSDLLNSHAVTVGLLPLSVIVYVNKLSNILMLFWSFQRINLTVLHTGSKQTVCNNIISIWKINS